MTEPTRRAKGVLLERVPAKWPRFAGKDALQPGNLELFPVHLNRENL
jgi:hypothetical protein